MESRSTKHKLYMLTEYANDVFSKKLYRLSLDGGFSCPNRDGKISTGGCTFCDGTGSGSFSGSRNCKDLPSITKQLAIQKELIKKKLPKTKPVGYIAYFQAYTGTYGNIDDLRNKYYEAINDKEVCVLSIATRPDCLNDDVLDLLNEINQVIPVWIELGLQTIHEKTAIRINRGYSLPVYEEALIKLKNIGISHIITHAIIGLPDESDEMILETIRYICDSLSDGIKISLLHILKNTQMEKEYLAGKVKVKSFEEYIHLLEKCILCIPPNMVVHRLTGDGDKRFLVAPMWSGDKKKVMAAISKILSN